MVTILAGLMAAVPSRHCYGCISADMSGTSDKNRWPAKANARNPDLTAKTWTQQGSSQHATNGPHSANACQTALA